MLVKIKTIATYEIEVESIDEAQHYYTNGMWDETDLTDDDAFELGYFDDKGEYHDITPK